MAKNTNLTMCSFCGKSQDQVQKLIAGPAIYICNECVNLCNDILNEEGIAAFEDDYAAAAALGMLDRKEL